MANLLAIANNCQRLIHKPSITKMGHFLVIVNCFQLFTIVTKSSVLNVVGFLDLPLHRSKSAAKVVGWFKSKWLYIHVYPCGKYLNKLERHVLEPNFIKFAALQPQLTQLQSHPSFIEFAIENKVWCSYSWMNFQPFDGNCNIIALLHLSVCMHTSSK